MSKVNPKAFKLSSAQKDYPLYEHVQRTENYFPRNFYERDNQNFEQHKLLEHRIFENRQKMVQLQKVLGPYAGYIKPDERLVPNSVDIRKVLGGATNNIQRAIPTTQRGLSKQKVDDLLGPY